MTHAEYFERNHILGSALLASCDFHKNEVQRPLKALLGDAWSEILVGLSELGLTILT